RRVILSFAMPDGAFSSHPARNKQTVSNAKLPDALRFSCLHDLCEILSLRAFLWRGRRSRRVRHKQQNKQQHPCQCAVFLFFLLIICAFPFFL
ncbi:hypothetical protein J4V11_21165, partial [Escherichia coli]